MRRAFALVCLLLLLLAARPATAAKVRSGYNGAFDFAAVKTYRWKKAEGPAAEDVDRRVRATAEEELAKKGLVPATGDAKPDVLLVYVVGAADMLVPGQTAEVGMYGDIWVVGAARSRMSGGILIEMRHPETDEAVWGASWVQTGNNPDTLMELRADAEKAVRKALAEYPPKKE